jgi:hypothetical protein
MQQTFFNTINEQQNIKEFSQKAVSQEISIFQIFSLSPEAELTPFDVLNILVEKKMVHENTPITSIRRAMSNLTRSGNLIKTEHQVPGELGKKNYCWKLNNNK